MVPSGGRKNSSVNDRLFGESYRFDFFQAVRLLERAALERLRDREGETNTAGPFQPVGQDFPPGAEVVRFRAMASLSFPPGPIAELKTPARNPDDEEAAPPQPEMIVSFLGLTGPVGVLPRHYTSMVLERLREKDTSMRDFFDLFNHRMVSLFYRAWEKYRFPMSYERARLYEGRDLSEELFTTCMYSLIGMSTPGLRGRQEVEDEHLLFYAGHFAHQPRSAVSLEMILADYFEVTASVDQFHGNWIYLRMEDRSCMPTRFNTLGCNNQLGRNVVIGERVWDIQGSFRVKLGPLTYEKFSYFLPDSIGLKALCQLVRTFAGPEFEFDVQPSLLAKEIPGCSLGSPVAKNRLGRNLWVKSKDFSKDFDGAVFALREI